MSSTMTTVRLRSIDANRRAVAAAAHLRAMGLSAGDRVALVAPGADASDAARTQAAVACVAFGALRAGIVPVMVNPLLSPDERAGYLGDAQVALTIDSAAHLEAITSADDHPHPPQLADVPQGRPMHFTSGTTGRSKGVWSPGLTESQASAYWQDEHEQWPLESGDVLLGHGPLAHSAPLRFSMLAFLHGADVVFTGTFRAQECAQAIRDHAPTVAMAVPTHLQRLLALPGGPPASTYRMLVHAGSACPPDLKRAIHEWAGADHVWEFLGSTEGQFTACTGLEWEERPGTLGRARVGRRLLIDDKADGAIWCQTPTFARFEYFGDEDKTTAAWRDTPDGGAFTVGDLGELDADGYLFLRGRRHDLIVTGGVNVYPAEVEAALRTCPGVTDAAVYGRPDQTWGERVCAAVVGDTTPEHVRAWSRTHLAAYRRPKDIAVVHDLPLTNNGKVLRVDLAAWVDQYSQDSARLTH